jgi:hypothetical protein
MGLPVDRGAGPSRARFVREIFISLSGPVMPLPRYRVDHRDAADALRSR